MEGDELDRLPEEPNLTDQRLIKSYRTISGKLGRRRFIFDRRHNAEEGLAEVLAWIEQAKRLGNSSYAAFAMLAAARCEQALGNPSKQALHLTHAGRTFFGIQSELESTRSLNFEENIAHATDCYLSAIKTYLSQKREAQAGALYYEMAILMEGMSKQAEAAGYFQEAASLQLHYSPMSAIICHQHAAQCFLLQRDYVSAINAYNTIVSLIASSAVDPQDLDEVDINEKREAPIDELRTKPLPEEETKDAPEESAGSTSSLRTAHLPPMQSSFVKALKHAKVCLLLLNLLQKQFYKARVLLRDFAPPAVAAAFDAKTPAPELLLTVPLAGEPEEYPFLQVPGWSNSLHFALHSTVVMCETRDKGIMEEMKRELWQHLDRTQWDIFQLILLDLRLS
jgi:tetratricopeptide (TPR) repeat protein